jgi:hypothetical protein
MGLPTLIMANMTSEQLEAYTLHLRIEEISQKLRINDVVPADGDRYAFLSSSLPSLSVSTMILTNGITIIGLLLLHLNMTTSAGVSIPGKIATRNVWKTSATS